MSPEPIMDALLRAPAVAAVVGTRVALEQLPQGSAYPAVVYRTVTATPVSRLCTPGSTYTSRVQVNPLAHSMGEVLSLHALVRTAVEGFAQRTVAGRRLVCAKFESLGPASKDEFTGVWTQPADYILTHE
jgi:hypothetical protein